MTTPPPCPSDPGPAHAPDVATRWFTQWHVYRTIVDANWMAHREIFAAIRSWVPMRYPGPFTLLDLGCGDAGAIEATFTSTGLWAYTGVDASPAALAEARRTLAGARFQVNLVEADMLAFLEQPATPPSTRWGVILASYAIHHLPAREKQEFFRLAYERLDPGGSLLVADIFRHTGETREEYLARYIGMMRAGWRALSPEGLASTIEHVTACDFPEHQETLAAFALAAGFREPSQELFRDATGFHRLMAFVQPSAPRT